MAIFIHLIYSYLHVPYQVLSWLVCSVCSMPNSHCSLTHVKGWKVGHFLVHHGPDYFHIYSARMNKHTIVKYNIFNSLLCGFNFNLKLIKILIKFIIKKSLAKMFNCSLYFKKKFPKYLLHSAGLHCIEIKHFYKIFEEHDHNDHYWRKSFEMLNLLYVHKPWLLESLIYSECVQMDFSWSWQCSHQFLWCTETFLKKNLNQVKQRV